ncbi:hypothetical protein [Burkholderia ubonensis]|uniref:hypothetical protein n=1 Tax=Burkholderia ubonensis TaxID=101571 RepID=UPI0012F8A354|nr:hypothetical protein [Burkholderia ubonensis]
MTRPWESYTTSELKLIKTHYPTSMPMRELCVLLSRHTKRSIETTARGMGLKRPNIQERPAWERMRSMLAGKEMTTKEIAAELGVCRRRVMVLIDANKEHLYVASKISVAKNVEAFQWAIREPS